MRVVIYLIPRALPLQCSGHGCCCLLQMRMLSYISLHWWHVCIILAFVIELGVRGSEMLAYRFTGNVGAGNYSYFKLHRDGLVKLMLNTTTGDADIYVSSTTLSPDYTNYELCSTTCGVDEVVIPSDMIRPVGVGVYGHPSHELSDFDLTVWVDGNTVSNNGDKVHLNSENEQEESLLWSVALGMLKILLDMLV